MALFVTLLLALLAGAHAELPGCKIRVTSQALELGKAGLRGRDRGVRREGARHGAQELRVSLLP